jgi:tetratricopeptide (TPR) repeat protein
VNGREARESGLRKGDLERADELASKALALDPDWTAPHDLKGNILRHQARYQEAVAEHERELALDRSSLYAAGNLGWDYAMLGEFDKLNISTRRFWRARTIRTSPIGTAARRRPISG